MVPSTFIKAAQRQVSSPSLVLKHTLRTVPDSIKSLVSIISASTSRSSQRTMTDTRISYASPRLRTLRVIITNLAWIRIFCVNMLTASLHFQDVPQGNLVAQYSAKATWCTRKISSANIKRSSEKKITSSRSCITPTSKTSSVGAVH